MSSIKQNADHGRILTVCVVGADVGGLIAAEELERRAYHVTVLEKEAEVVEKLKSFVYDEQTYNIGAAIGSQLYKRLQHLAKQHGMSVLYDFAPWTGVALPAHNDTQKVRYSN